MAVEAGRLQEVAARFFTGQPTGQQPGSDVRAAPCGVVLGDTTEVSIPAPEESSVDPSTSRGHLLICRPTKDRRRRSCRQTPDEEQKSRTLQRRSPRPPVDLLLSSGPPVAVLLYSSLLRRMMTSMSSSNRPHLQRMQMRRVIGKWWIPRGHCKADAAHGLLLQCLFGPRVLIAEELVEALAQRNRLAAMVDEGNEAIEKPDRQNGLGVTAGAAVSSAEGNEAIEKPDRQTSLGISAGTAANSTAGN